MAITTDVRKWLLRQMMSENGYHNDLYQKNGYYSNLNHKMAITTVDVTPWLPQ